MSMFTLAISCLITFNLPWFMDIIFQVPMQYCSLQHWNLLPSPVTYTTECCFCFGSVSSFLLELFFYSSLIVYQAPADLWSSSFSVLSFCLFILFMGFARHEYWSGFPMDHIFSVIIFRRNKVIHSQHSKSTGSISTNSTNCGSKIFLQVSKKF